MGRLDNVAKHKVVELRKAGLSFRKIKAVLELEDIKVSAQAIYLFLREFEGRPMVRVKPPEAGGGTSSAQTLARTRTAQQNWSDIHLQNLLREAAQQSGFAKQTSSNSETTPNSSGSGETSTGSRPEQQYKGNKDENDIQIVSVTSLAQHSQQRASQSSVTRAETAAVSSAPSLTSGAMMRKRVTASPATSAMLAARKRLLDKALSQRLKPLHQLTSTLRRDHTSVQGAEMRSAVTQPPNSYNLTAEKTVMEPQPGSSTQRRFLAQRPGPTLRSPHPLPRVGIRLPSRPLPPATSSSAPGPAVIRLQTPGSQGASRSEGIPSPQAQDAAARSSLPDQIHTLSSEMRSLGFAVKMLVEQQCRLEREQAQQTQIQREILATLQTLTSKMGSCSRTPQQQQHNKTPSPSSAAASNSFSQDTFNFTPNSFTQCSQSQSSFNSLESLDNVDTFKLPELRPTSMNGFPACSNAETVPLTHTPSQTQAYTSPYTEQSNATLLPPYTQPYVSSYDQSLPATFGASEGKTSDFHISCAARTFQDCSVSSPSLINSSRSSQEMNITNIKVETP